uniref:Uncharacterized protein n=1 Tax=Daphnia magna TaxID=35525 RepID=A0A0P6D6J6_9CRUS
MYFFIPKLHQYPLQIHYDCELKTAKPYWHIYRELLPRQCDYSTHHCAVLHEGQKFP